MNMNNNNDLENTQIEKQDVLTMQIEKQELEDEIMNATVTNVPRALEKGFHDAHYHSIESYLSRPQMLNVISWSTTNKAFDLLQFMTMPSAILDRKYYKDKLSGLASFKATVCMKIQINTTPFVAGRLLLTSIPMPNALGWRKSSFNATPDKVLCLPHVELDVSKTTSVVLRAPFISPLTTYDLINREEDWAQFRIYVYSPLTTIGTLTLNIEPLIWFEDIELGPVTSASYQPPAVKEYQMGKPTQAQINAAQQSEKAGPVGKIANIASDGVNLVGSWISSVFPSAKPFTDSVSSIGNGVSGLISAIGFSKPNNDINYITTLTCGDSFGNCDGVDNSKSLGLYKNNSIAVMEGPGGTSVDEMSFDYVKLKPNYLGQITWNKGDGAKKTIASILVSPAAQSPIKYFHDAKHPNLSVCSNLSYLTAPFQQWTGSLVYNFKFVKTDFHSGRILVQFNPFSVANIPVENDIYTYSTILDIRESNEFEIMVPYVAAKPWKVIDDNMQDVMKPPEANAIEFATGILSLTVLTPLQASSTIVAPNINCIVEMRAGKDFRVAIPIRELLPPLMNDIRDGSTKPPVTDPKPKPKNEIVSKQYEMGLVVDGLTQTEKMNSDGFDIVGKGQNNNIDAEMYSIGEVFSNFRVLLKRFGFANKITIGPIMNHKTTGNLKLKHHIDPREYITCLSAQYDLIVEPTKRIDFNRFIVGAPLNFVAPSISYSHSTYLSYISSMYAFTRGSIRMKIISSVSDGTIMMAQLLSTTGQTYGTGKTSRSSNSSNQYTQTNINKTLEVSIPYYSPTHVTNTYNPVKIGTHPMCALSLSAEKDITVSIAVAGGDDYDCMCYLGPPLCLAPGRANNFYYFENPNAPTYVLTT